MMEYNGYVATVEFDSSVDTFTGHVLHMRDVIHFEGRSVDDLRQAFHDAVDDYLEMCDESGEQPERPFSGRLLLRLDPELHRDVAVESELCATSINQWISDVVRDAVGTAKASRSANPSSPVGHSSRNASAGSAPIARRAGT